MKLAITLMIFFICIGTGGLVSGQSNSGDILTKAKQLFKELDSLHLKFQFNLAHEKLDSVINLIEHVKEEEPRYYLETLLRLASYLSDTDSLLRLNKSIIKKATLLFGEKDTTLAKAYYGLGRIYDRTNDYTNGISCVEKSKSIYIQLEGQEKRVAMCNQYIAGLYADAGNVEIAKTYYAKALSQYKHLYGDESWEIGQINHNIGILILRNSSKFNGSESALPYLQESLRIWTKIRGELHTDVALVYGSLSNCSIDIENYEDAIAFNTKSQEIYRKLLGEKHPRTLACSSRYALICYLKGDLDQAIEVQLKRIEALVTEYSKESAYRALSVYYQKKKEYDKSLYYADKSVKAFDFDENSNYFMDMNTALPIALSMKAGALKRLYYHTDSIYYLHESSKYYYYTDQVLFFRNKISDFKQEPLIYYGETENAIGIEKKIADLEKNSKNFDRIFEYFERTKSLLLYKNILKSKASILEKLPDSLLEYESLIKKQILELEKSKRSLTNNDRLLLGNDSKLLSIIDSSVIAYGRLDSLIHSIDEEYRQYAQLKYSTNLASIEDVQSEGVNGKQSLVTYFLGDSTLYIFLINKDTFLLSDVLIDFPIKKWIDSLVNLMKQPLSKDVSISRKRIVRNEYVNYATLLYEKLILPINNLLKEDVIIIPDGELGYIPFEVLLKDKPTNIEDYTTYPFLLKDKNIHYNYSVSLAKEMKQKRHRIEPSLGALIMAPFATNTGVEYLNVLDSLELDITTRDSLTELRHSGVEAKAVLNKTKGMALYGREATSERFTEEAENYQILHLVTHGIADDRLGDYAYLAFQRPVSDKTYTKLYVRDIYHLSLNADMVVLSACETGVGTLKKGEGIISIARAFAFAGAKSIFTTLWNIDDRSTSRLMNSFYEYLYKGMPKDAALRQAKLDFIVKENAHPYFWAAFIGIGDMSPLPRR